MTTHEMILLYSSLQGVWCRVGFATFSASENFGYPPPTA